MCSYKARDLVPLNIYQRLGYAAILHVSWEGTDLLDQIVCWHRGRWSSLINQIIFRQMVLGALYNGPNLSGALAKLILEILSVMYQSLSLHAILLHTKLLMYCKYSYWQLFLYYIFFCVVNYQSTVWIVAVYSSIYSITVQVLY